MTAQMVGDRADLFAGQRFLFGPPSPLSIPWHSAFWAEDPAWIPPGNGGPVDSWRNAGAGDFGPAAQATASRQPIYRASVAALNYRPALEFDGSDDSLQTAAGTAIATGTLVVIGNLTASGGNRYVVDGRATANRWLFGGASSGAWIFYQGLNLTGGATNTAAHFFQAVAGATDTLHVDGSATASGNAGTESLTGLTLGSRWDQGAFWAAANIAFVGVLDRVLTADEIAHLKAWAADHYGLTIAA